MTLRTRLQRLEQRLHLDEPGCPACRERRGRCVLVTSTRQADGTVLPSPDLPRPCARCGKLAEYVIEVIETVVEERVWDCGPFREGRGC